MQVGDQRVSLDLRRKLDARYRPAGGAEEAGQRRHIFERVDQHPRAVGDGFNPGPGQVAETNIAGGF